MSPGAEIGEITTQVPSRLDRLPWSAFHWRVVIGLGSVWILDGLEVTMVGGVAARLTDSDSGIDISAGQIGTAAAIYIVGACLGALFFGQLTDRFGRKKLFMLTLGIYIVATVATAFSFSPWYFYLCRFVTGAGIGGEYAAINSAIDELIPARVRGRVDLIINGSYWLGSAAGSALLLLLLDKNLLAADVGWRFGFGLGAILGLFVFLVRRNVPESPRWLFIHGQEEEAERIVGEIEDEIVEETGEDLSEPEDSLTVRQRTHIPFSEIAKVAFTRYPKRAFLGLALFIGQAFIYNGVTFNLGTLLKTFYGVASGTVPLFIIIWALSNFLGPLILGRLFDTVGRKPMISGTYIGSGLVAIVLALILVGGVGNEWLFIAVLMVCFFLASAGASAAYLTVSEIFPMETRALAIAFFYAFGTAIGGITGPLLFGHLIGSGKESLVSIAFYIGAGVMIAAGVVEIFFGVKAEGATLEDLAEPLTTVDADEGASDPEDDEPEPHDTGGSRSDEDRSRHERMTDRAQRRSTPVRGPARVRPGPGRVMYAPWMSMSSATDQEGTLDREIESIARVVAEHGPIGRDALARKVDARAWGPGRFSTALREAALERRVVALPKRRFGPPSDD